MSSVSLQPKVGTGTNFFCSRSFNHPAQKNALSWKSKLQATRTPLRVYCMQVYIYINVFIYFISYIMFKYIS